MEVMKAVGACKKTGDLVSVPSQSSPFRSLPSAGGKSSASLWRLAQPFCFFGLPVLSFILDPILCVWGPPDTMSYCYARWNTSLAIHAPVKSLMIRDLISEYPTRQISQLSPVSRWCSELSVCLTPTCLL